MSARYDIVARLGTGGMGDVFLARMHRGGDEPRMVALKRVREGLALDATARARFQQEARLCATLSHPNIVALVDWGADRTGPYLAMEYVQGRTASALRRAYESSGVPLAVALGIALDVAQALAHAHDAAVIHRDVSLDNVLISETGIAQLTDFGVAKIQDETGLTQSGGVVGKWGYIAPELFEGQAVGTSVDVFSFGVAVYWLLCQVPPFVSDSDAGLMRAVLSATPPPPRSLRPDIPEGVNTLLLRCLAKSPLERPAMTEVVSLLRHQLAGEPDRSGIAAAVKQTGPQEIHSPAEGTQRVFFPPTGERAPWKFAVLGVILLAVGASVAMTLLSRRHPQTPPVPSATDLILPPVKVHDTPSEGNATSTSPVKAEPPPLERTLTSTPREAATPATKEPTSRAAVRPRALQPAGRKSPTTGVLKLSVTPWGHVFVDGQLEGASPLGPLELSAGQHSVLIVNQALGARQTRMVTIRAGQTSRLSVKLEGAETSEHK
jgi:hypothetical protein